MVVCKGKLQLATACILFHHPLTLSQPLFYSTFIKCEGGGVWLVTVLCVLSCFWIFFFLSTSYDITCLTRWHVLIVQDCKAVSCFCSYKGSFFKASNAQSVICAYCNCLAAFRPELFFPACMLLILWFYHKLLLSFIINLC